MDLFAKGVAGIAKEPSNEVMEAVARLVPHDMTIAALIRSCWEGFIKPHIPLRDVVAAQHDGYVTLRLSLLVIILSVSRQAKDQLRLHFLRPEACKGSYREEECQIFEQCFDDSR